MGKYEEAKKIISNFYDTKLKEIVAQIPTDSLNGNGMLEDMEVREALIYHLDRALYNRMEFNFIGEYIYRDIIYALRNVNLPIEEIDAINQQRRGALERILDIEMTAYDDARDTIVNVMIGHDFIGLRENNTEVHINQANEFTLIRNVLMGALVPDPVEQIAAEEDIARILEIFRDDLENLRILIAGINQDRDTTMQNFIEQIDDENSMSPQANASDSGSLSSSGFAYSTSGGLSPITPQHAMSNGTIDGSELQGITITIVGVCPNPEGSSSFSASFKSSS